VAIVLFVNKKVLFSLLITFYSNYLVVSRFILNLADVLITF